MIILLLDKELVNKCEYFAHTDNNPPADKKYPLKEQGYKFKKEDKII